MAAGQRRPLANLSSVPGFVAAGTIALPTGGGLAICDCADSTHNSTLIVDGSTFVTEIYKEGRLLETVDRALTPTLLLPHALPGSAKSNPGHSTTVAAAATTKFLLLQRHGMWEFYLGGFLILPERLASAYNCLELHTSGGLVVEEGWAMNAMPPSTPVPVAPTYGGR